MQNQLNIPDSQLKFNNSNSPWMIKAIHLKKKYKNTDFYSVDDLNITIEKGMVFGILGPNGAGKTTVLSMLCGLLKPTSGEIHYAGIQDLNMIKKNIGLVPQELAIYPKLTARENLLFFGNLYQIPKNTLNSKIKNLLNLIGLEKRADDLVQHYSAGMKRRLNLAVGLIHEPQIILLDEPTVGIDPQSRNCIYNAILNLKNNGTTLLYTTHYMEEASKLCDQVVIMDHGKIILSGPPDGLVEKYGLYKIIFKSTNGYDKVFLAELKKLNEISSFNVENTILILTVTSKSDNIKVIELIDHISKQLKLDIILKKIEEPTLESLFLDLTGRMLRDEPDITANGESSQNAYYNNNYIKRT